MHASIASTHFLLQGVQYTKKNPINTNPQHFPFLMKNSLSSKLLAKKDLDSFSRPTQFHHRVGKLLIRLASCN